MQQNELPGWKDFLLFFAVSLGLTWVFWSPLWLGGGLIGGDTYNYFFPQKQFLAEQLRLGNLPTWNDRTGFGYPLVAESQTAPFYPPHLVLYRLFDVNRAYNLNQLLHYLFAFVVLAWYARLIGLGNMAALLAATIYTYGWFPPRICLEWAIIGGMYLPLGLILLERFLRSRQWRYLMLLAVMLGVQMLAGHYHLAFINQLLLVGYGLARIWWVKEPAEVDSSNRKRTSLLLGVCLLSGFGIAALQLLPTWELKSHSQRSPAAQFNFQEGHLPPLYVSQMFYSWWGWYAPESNLPEVLPRLKWGALDAPTNPVEAHLYFGLVPFLLGMGLLGGIAWRRVPLPPLFWLWGLLGLLALVAAMGWLAWLFQYLPAFGWFRGLGRYGIITTLAASVWIGLAWQRWRNTMHSHWGCLLFGVILLLTVLDLRYVSRLVTYAGIQETPVMNKLQQSPVRAELSKTASPRVFAPGANLVNLLGVSQYPIYLGLGPEEYFDPELIFPATQNNDQRFSSFNTQQVQWLQHAGVTHVLAFAPLTEGGESFDLVWNGYDPFLNAAWGRSQPLYLYQLKDTRGRFAWREPAHAGTIFIQSLSAEEVILRTETDQPGELVFTELHYPGWEVRIDGEPDSPLEVEGIFQGVAVPSGEHEIHWRYRSNVLFLGAGISLLSLLLMFGVAVYRGKTRPQSMKPNV